MTAHIVAACRTAVAPRGGTFDALALHDLAAPVVTAALKQAGIESARVDELILSNALGAGGNPARIVALAAGLPQHVAGLSIDRQCAGGMDAVRLARQMILAGEAQVVVCGGAESYSRRPQRLHTFANGRPPQPYDQAPFTPWPDRDPQMAQAAADLATMLDIDKQEQDTWAIESHAKARMTTADTDEIVPLNGLSQDAFTRDLKPAHCARAKVLTGTITAANAAVAADAAAFCVVVSDQIAKRLTAFALPILSAATCGHLPEQPGLSPLPAIAQSLARAGLTAQNLDVVEMMEAYAVQAIACIRGARLDPAQVNIGGGALARGHPIGASGAINVVRLFHILHSRGSGTGLATIAAAGGVGSALVLGT